MKATEKLLKLNESQVVDVFLSKSGVEDAVLVADGLGRGK